MNCCRAASSKFINPLVALQWNRGFYKNVLEQCEPARGNELLKMMRCLAMSATKMIFAASIREPGSMCSCAERSAGFPARVADKNVRAPLLTIETATRPEGELPSAMPAESETARAECEHRRY